MNRESGLKDLMSTLPNALPRTASTETEQRLMAAFRTRRKNIRRARIWGAGLAACLILALSWFTNHHPQPAAKAIGGAERYQAIAAGFVPLPYAESDVPMEEAVIVRVKLRPAELGSLGLPVAHIQPSASVNAELLVGQDGVARGVRVIE